MISRAGYECNQACTYATPAATMEALLPGSADMCLFLSDKRVDGEELSGGENGAE